MRRYFCDNLFTRRRSDASITTDEREQIGQKDQADSMQDYKKFIVSF